MRWSSLLRLHQEQLHQSQSHLQYTLKLPTLAPALAAVALEQEATLEDRFLLEKVPFNADETRKEVEEAAAAVPVGAVARAVARAMAGSVVALCGNECRTEAVAAGQCSLTKAVGGAASRAASAAGSQTGQGSCGSSRK